MPLPNDTVDCVLRDGMFVTALVVQVMGMNADGSMCYRIAYTTDKLKVETNISDMQILRLNGEVY